MLDDEHVQLSKVVEVNKLTDLNDMFLHITKIDILLKEDEYTEALLH